MKHILVLSLLTVTTLMAGKLTVVKGSIQAHTEVFGDSTIDPATTGIISHLRMKKGIESLSGSVDISLKKLKSDNKDRDEHMVKVIQSNKYPLAKYTFKKVRKTTKGYIIDGVLKFHGIEKAVQVNATIQEDKKTLHIKGKSSFLLSNFNIKPIKMFFLTVRDQIDIAINVTFKKR